MGVSTRKGLSGDLRKTTKPKDQGGLGIIDLRAHNTTLKCHGFNSPGVLSTLDLYPLITEKEWILSSGVTSCLYLITFSC
jgi:hypothetical protein